MTDLWSTGERMARWQGILRDVIVNSGSFHPSERVVAHSYHGWLGKTSWISAGGATKASFVVSAVGTTRICVTITSYPAEIPLRELDAWAEWVFSQLAERADMDYSHAGVLSAAIFKNKRRLHGANGPSN